MTTPEQIKQFLLDRRELLNIKEIEIKAGLYKSSLSKYLTGAKYRTLTPEQVDKLVPVLREIGFKTEPELECYAGEEVKLLIKGNEIKDPTKYNINS